MTDPHDWSDTLTILRARSSKPNGPPVRLAKTIHADGSVQSYDGAYKFDIACVPVKGLFDLHDKLKWLVRQYNKCVVRGTLIEGTKASNVRRLFYRCAESGDAPTLRDMPHRWVALDVDGLARPEDIPVDDIERCADYAMGKLPRIFGQTACIAQASAQHGIKPDIRLRLWYWCDRPMGGDELKRWLKDTPCDMSVFNPAQPIYTAFPLFASGRPDHLRERLLYLDGLEWLRCPSPEELAPPPRATVETIRPACVAGSARAQLYVDAAIASVQDRIRSASLRHPTILQEACSLARLVHSGLMTTTELHNAMWKAAAAAGKDDQKEVARIVTFAMANSSTADVPAELVNG